MMNVNVGPMMNVDGPILVQQWAIEVGRQWAADVGPT